MRGLNRCSTGSNTTITAPREVNLLCYHAAATTLATTNITTDNLCCWSLVLLSYCLFLSSDRVKCSVALEGYHTTLMSVTTQ